MYRPFTIRLPKQTIAYIRAKAQSLRDVESAYRRFLHRGLAHLHNYSPALHLLHETPFHPVRFVTSIAVLNIHVPNLHGEPIASDYIQTHQTDPYKR